MACRIYLDAELVHTRTPARITHTTQGPAGHVGTCVEPSSSQFFFPPKAKPQTGLYTIQWRGPVHDVTKVASEVHEASALLVPADTRTPACRIAEGRIDSILGSICILFWS